MTSTTSTQWIKRNMMGHYSEELGRPLTDAEIRALRSTAKLEVPDWYRKYRRPSNILKNNVPIESRPALWRTMSVKGKNDTISKSKTTIEEDVSGRTSSADSGYGDAHRVCRSRSRFRNNVPLNSSSTVLPESSVSDNDVSRVAIKSRNDTPSSSSSGLDSDTLESLIISKHDISNNAKPDNTDLNVSSTSSTRNRLNASYTYPRVSPSRKIDNINIVLNEPFPPEQVPLTIDDFSSDLTEIDSLTTNKSKSELRTHYTITKNIAMYDRHDNDHNDTSNNGMPSNKSYNTDTTLPLNDSVTHTSIYVADISPEGIRERVRVYAGLDENDEVKNATPSSPTTARFRASNKKSTVLEKIVQSKLRNNEQVSAIRNIINVLDRKSLTGGCVQRESNVTRRIDDARRNFVRSMVDVFEDGNDAVDNNDDDDEDDDVKPLNLTFTLEKDVTSDDEDNGSTDSELPKSTSISFGSYDCSITDERTITPLPCFDDFNGGFQCDEQLREESQQTDNADGTDNVYWAPCKHELPRTSSRLSVASTKSNVSNSSSSTMSSNASTFGHEVRNLSPIEHDMPNDWITSRSMMKMWNTSSSDKSNGSSRLLFRIDETDTKKRYRRESPVITKSTFV